MDFFIYFLLYINDISLRNLEGVKKLKAQLSREFEIKDLGEAKKILDMKINRDRKKGKLV